ncbi:hypothetical protein DFJ74DRAFT_738306 [Hyaloraphidium curvatum]|nr:hypothetical protein DFJ74DRAFT_738306 [Hyaloraphidium curvatum]
MPAALTDEELSVALPFVGKPPAPRPFDGGGPDAAMRALLASLSAAERPTAAGLQSAAARSSRFLGFLARCSLPFNQPGTVRWFIVLCPLLSAAVLGLVAAYPALAGTAAPFGAKNLALGSVAYAIFVFAVSVPMLGVFRMWDASTDLRQQPLTLFWRWRLAVDRTPSFNSKGQPDEELAAPALGRLVAHKEGDPTCPCHLPSCAGNLGHQAGLWTLGDILGRFGLLFAMSFTPLWTPMVSSAFLWKTWWGTLIGVIVLVMNVSWSLFLCVTAARRFRAAMTQLSGRLMCRCIAVELGNVLDEYEHDRWGQAESKRDWAPVYAILNYLTHAWGAWHNMLLARTYTVISFAVLPPVILNLAAGACIPLWELCAGAWWLFYILDNLGVYAASNARIGAAADVLREGADAARAIAAESADAAARAGLPDPALAAALRDHAARLEACTARWAPARFLGFEVTYGALRALVATLLTVGFALWGMLRGLGVTVVLESYCYG